MELQQNRLNHERRTLEGRRIGWEEQLAGHERAVRNATRRVEEVESGHKRIASEITALQSEIEGVRRKVFDEVFGFIDERNGGEGGTALPGGRGAGEAPDPDRL